MKRLIDVIVATAMLVLLSPLLTLICLLVWFKLGRPILFVQQRTGLRGQLFYLYKFRSMRSDRGTDGYPLPDADRLPPFGQWLRKTSIDELPELFNIVRGDMSLVGPRPLLPEYLPYYSSHQMRRHEVRPGLTGWAQTNGRNALSWDERFDLDVWYADNHSLWLDIKILFKTVAVVFAATDVSAENHATMPPFAGLTHLNKPTANDSSKNVQS